MVRQAPPTPDKITCPVLIIYGSMDEATLSQMKMFDSLTGTRDKSVKVVQGAPHIGWAKYGQEYDGVSSLHVGALPLRQAAAIASFLNGRH